MIRKYHISYDFIEIGTANWGTEIEKATNDTVGLSIEPLKFYLDELPNRDYVIKVNKAISDKKGYVKIYYLDPKDIDKYKMPKWLKGCNSLEKIHPSLSFLPRRYKLLIKTKKVPVITFEDLAQEYNIHKIKYLKIDTEGHDIKIIKSLIDYCDKNNATYPDKIKFESIAFITEEGDRKVHDLDDVIKQLKDRGYRLIRRGWDTILKKI